MSAHASIKQKEKQKCCWPDFGWVWVGGITVFYCVFGGCCMSQGTLCALCILPAHESILLSEASPKAP